MSDGVTIDSIARTAFYNLIIKQLERIFHNIGIFNKFITLVINNNNKNHNVHIRTIDTVNKQTKMTRFGR